MKGDFSRITFDAANHFSRVLMQQGRVTLDADPNEQGAILLHYLRTLARDLIGPCGGPGDALGFQLEPTSTAGSAGTTWTLHIGPGRYYVDGILCENEQTCSYAKQPDYTLPQGDPLLNELGKAAPSSPATAFWLYLDVWERHITPIEDDRMREVALGGPDTATRAKVVWQVKALARPAPANLDPPGALGKPCTEPLEGLTAISGGRMAAELDPGEPSKDPCVVAPDARYRGAENQLYRVEVHRGNVADHGDSGGVTPTFKWSRDNGSVASAWLGTEGHDLIVASTRGFSAGAWIELSDDTKELRGEPGVLCKLSSVDGNRLSVDPSSVPPSASLAWAAGLRSPKIRRWDQAETDDITLVDGAVPITQATAAQPHWIDLEDGVRVQFGPGADGKFQYRSGDYWLIPARVATGDIEWPRTGDAADLLPPRGIEHHHAPLGWLTWSDADKKWVITSCLCTLHKLSPCDRSAPREAALGASRLRPVQPSVAHAAPAPAPSRPGGSRSSEPRPK